MRYTKLSVKRRIAFILLLVISMSGESYLLNSSARANRSITHRMFNTTSLLLPTQPGTNGKIAFTSMRNGDAEIYIMNADGSNQVNLTKNPARDTNPAWSPDGSRIAFVSDRSGDENVYAMNADGSNVTNITQYNYNGTVTVGRPGVADPTWSPDGSKLAFIQSISGNSDSLNIINVDGSGLKTLASGLEAVDPEWSPDGTRIAFTGRFGPFNLSEGFPAFLFLVNADGSGRTRIADFPNTYEPGAFPPNASGPAWSPDGTSIVYSYDNGSDTTQTPRRIGDLAVVKVTDGSFKFLTSTSATESQPSWSPDGARLAFTSNRDGHKEIYVINADGSEPLRLTNNNSGNFDPNWQTLNQTTPSTPTQSTIQFSSPSFRVHERLLIDHTKDPLTVTRLGDLSHEASVDYATSDTAGLTPCNQANTGIASSRCDYITTSGTLYFAPGEASKSINVQIVDDSYIERDESFFVSLSNPTGCALGGNQKATAIITDNDTPVPGAPVPPPNPIDGKSFFVYQHYVDFLNREPEPGGYNGWIDILNNCPQGDTRCDRIEVSSDFFRSSEFQGRGYFVFRFYTAALGRNPTYTEFMPALGRVSGFQTDAELEASKVAFINDVMTQQEFKQKYDLITDPTAYVDAILGTAGVTLPQRQMLIDDLAQGRKTRAGTLRAIMETTEVYNKYYNTAFVVMQYFGYLRRDPDILYLNWIDTLNRTGDYRTMINGFMNAVEYRQRFGP